MVSAAREVSAEAGWGGRSRVHPKLKRRTVQSRSTEGVEARESTKGKEIENERARQLRGPV
jgi:hypothetical protein